jgi:hypothetical protein
VSTRDFHLAWYVWLGAVVISFAVLEIWALVLERFDNASSDTLTETLRPLLMDPRMPQWWVGIALVIWLSYHLFLYWVK